MAKSRDRLKAVKTVRTAVEAYVSAVKLQAVGKLEAASDAMQAAVLATKEAPKKRPFSKREQPALDAILRGGERPDSERSLGEIFCGPSPPSPDEARDRVQRYLGGLNVIVGAMESRTEKGRRGVAGDERANTNRELEEALAEIQLPTKKGDRRDAAEKHLKDNHPGLWLKVERRVKDPWFRERMRCSEKVRAKRLVSKTLHPAKNRR
jgi:hypothetical protein